LTDSNPQIKRLVLATVRHVISSMNH